MQPKDLIKDKLSIVDVISSYLPVIESGKNYKARCPFHNEKTPSFFISPERNTYYCFGCGEKGDIFSFVEKFEGTDFMGALKLLASRAGVELKYDRSNGQAKDDKERWLSCMEDATSFYENNLANYPEARAYLISRGLTNETIAQFRIGYAKDEWRSVSDYLIKKGYSKKDLETVGLIKIKEGSGNGENNSYDRFRSRIMFPISDSSGRVIAFSGRIFGRDDKDKEVTEAKYINSPDSPLFNKSNVLFGIDKAKTAIRTRGYSIIVEGQMDLIMSHQAGFSNTVAVSGTALSDSIVESKGSESDIDKINNLGLVRRLSPNVIFAYDGDSAGIRAASRSAKIALSLDMQVKVAVLPEGKDPADIIRDDPDAWKEIVKGSVNIVSFHIDRICRSTNDLRIRGRQIKEIVFPFIAMVGSAIERSAYINEVHAKTGITTEALVEDFKAYAKNAGVTDGPTATQKPATPSPTESRRSAIEKKLFGILFWHTKNAENTDHHYSEFKERVGNTEYERMYVLYEPFADTLAFQAETWYNSDIKAPIRDIPEILLSLEEEILNERKLALLADINHKENGTKDVRDASLEPVLLEYQKIIQRIQDIKSKRSQ
jgi:DNA primase